MQFVGNPCQCRLEEGERAFGDDRLGVLPGDRFDPGSFGETAGAGEVEHLFGPLRRPGAKRIGSGRQCGRFDRLAATVRDLSKPPERLQEDVGRGAVA
ncbi:MAG TPA: hypothetical protein DCP38_14225 [Acidobacteria bacterium]|nr:hypothetical protein [Acidobacteriota bacterium]HAK56620.1 hypothetical protein [Acidobacteriota bacterium]